MGATPPVSHATPLPGDWEAHAVLWTSLPLPLMLRSHRCRSSYCFVGRCFGAASWLRIHQRAAACAWLVARGCNRHAAFLLSIFVVHVFASADMRALA
ncbi:hypothetical protein EON66_09290 [archaeon]|nr:MAG: hypothetical protein EON66_09290 [archaeon]